MKFEFTEIDGHKFAIIKLNGIFDYEATISLAAGLKNDIPFDYEGNIIIDVRDTDVRLTNDDVDKVVENATEMARYALRKPHALIVQDSSTDHSWGLFASSFERSGIAFGQFKTMEAAVDWLKTAEATG